VKHLEDLGVLAVLGTFLGLTASAVLVLVGWALLDVLGVLLV
jgi:hypothetical protein